MPQAWQGTTIPSREETNALLKAVKWATLVAAGLFALAMVLGVSGVLSPFPDADISHQKPFANFIGREYRVTSDVAAYAWNDFPDKAKILSITLMPPPGVRNRFVSYVTPLKRGQRIRLVGAWRRFTISGLSNYYVVAVPGAGLPEGIKIKMDVNPSGMPDSRLYEAVAQ